VLVQASPDRSGALAAAVETAGITDGLVLGAAIALLDQNRLGGCTTRRFERSVPTGSNPTAGRAIRTAIMSQDELQDESMVTVRELRERGYSPKEIARALHVAPAVVAPLIRAMAQEKEAMAPEPAVVGCWASRGWSEGLSVKARPDWPDLEGGDPSASGLVGVVVAREHRYDKVSVCG
jgi:hypothetical protein